MDKNFLPFSDNNGCVNCNDSVVIPKCINDDFCVASPMPRNNGILTMAFVDMQPIDSVYPEAKAFCSGTLFPNLNKPFYGGKMK